MVPSLYPAAELGGMMCMPSATVLVLVLSSASASSAAATAPAVYPAGDPFAGDLSGAHLHLTTVHNREAMNMFDSAGTLLPWSQWYGFQRDVIDEVAKRVCPWNRVGATPGSSSRENFFMSRSHRSVRFPLTTRLRTPRTFEPLPWYVIRPALCAPRIIVTRSIVESSSLTFGEARLSSSIKPKLPQAKRSHGFHAKTSVVIASMATSQTTSSEQFDAQPDT